MPDVFARARALWRKGEPWSGLPGDALAFVLSGVLGSDPALVVVDEPDAARRLVDALRFFRADARQIELFPADDTRPYDGFSPSADVEQQRLRVLHRLDEGADLLVVAPVRALMQRIPDAATRGAGTARLRVGELRDRDDLTRWLVDAGYLSVDRVQVPGSFAVRGDVVDVWSAGVSSPRRVDFFDDEVEAIRRLDPRTGRAGAPVRQLRLLPAREARLDAAAVDRAQQELSSWVSEQGWGIAQRRRVLEELRAGIRASALSDLLPALVPVADPLDALGRLPRILVHPNSVAASARDLEATAQRRWSELDEDERPLVPPSARFVGAEAVLASLDGAQTVLEYGGRGRADSLGAESTEGLAVRGTDLGPTVARLRKLAADGASVALVADSARRATMLQDLFAGHEVELVGRVDPLACQPGEVSLLIGELSQGFIAAAAGWAFIPATALFGGRSREASRRAHELFDVSVTEVSDLKEGDPVVHRQHGVGLYRGLVRVPTGEATQDFAQLEYRGGDLLFVPVTALSELSRLTRLTAGNQITLDRLGGVTWDNRRGKVRDSLLKAAQGLIKLQAARELAEREPLPPPGDAYRQFEARFPYTETPDQAQAILDVGEDLSKDVPMDRLICGDVGFGKTEVAMRATMRVVESGSQVIVLCPTTVLAFQHHLTFVERFDGFDVRIGLLTRFSSPAEVREVLDGLADGSIDVVIGTHKLLGRGVRIPRLGLAVVDEEHRFGVRQKDQLRRLRTEVDVLSMSATPIPRSLQMALSGMRPMSVMATPPRERLEVRTVVARLAESRVRDAIRTELSRGGQVFFVHNRIESIGAVADKLQAWVPEARFAVAHGQLEGEALERILVDFMERRFDVLVSTAIVESGVDLPNVNTMLVNRADLFGLSQLYQLRGRVGRGSTRGNCLLLTPESITRDARRRLEVLVDNTRLGSGFAIAAADLEIRGGGNLLGTTQHGHIDAVGYEMWVELLEDAIQEAQGQAARARIDPEVELPVDAFLPDTLLPDVQQRLGWYRRISGAGTPAGVDAALADLKEVVGPLPPEVEHLGELVIIRLLCRDLGITRLSWLKVRVMAELHPRSLVDPAVVARLVDAHPKRMSVERDKQGALTSVSARFSPREARKPIVFVRWLLARLSGS